jgi:hypothetical protein
MMYERLSARMIAFLTATALVWPTALLQTSTAYAESESSAKSEVVPVEECDGVHMPGLWISGEALHDLHQAYEMERAKRQRLEQMVDVMEQIDRVIEVSQAHGQTGAHWAWWVTWGAVTFSGGMVIGLTLSK